MRRLSAGAYFDDRAVFTAHIVGLVAVGALGYDGSLPGNSLLALLTFLACAGTGAVCWLATTGRLLRAGMRSPGMLLAPVAMVVLMALTPLHLPLSERFAVSQPFFDRVVHSYAGRAHPTSSWQLVPAPTLIGTYAITEADLVRDGGVIFYEATGNMFDDAGFAYLPMGPSTGIEADAGGGFESPQ